MKRYLAYAGIMSLVLIVSSCKISPEKKILTQNDFPKPPVAAIKPTTFDEFGNKRTDNYFWLKDKSNPEVLSYLKAENAYFDTVMAPLKNLENKIYLEMKGRIRETDTTAPQMDNGYYYYSRTVKDKQYAVFCRKKGSLTAPEEVIFDVNRMAEPFNAYLFTGYLVSDDNKLAAYLFNTTGSYASFTLRFRDLQTGMDLPDSIIDVQSFSWAADNKTIFYSVGNKSLRSWRIYRHELGTKTADALVYEDPDDLFNVYVGRSKTKDYILISSRSFTTSETLLIPAREPKSAPVTFLKKQQDISYWVEPVKDSYLILYKDKVTPNKKIFLAPAKGYADRSTWKTLVDHDPLVKIENMEVFEKYLVLEVRENGLTGIRVMNRATGKFNSIKFPEPVYSTSLSNNPEYAVTKVRYDYTSLNRPQTVFDYDMEKGVSIKIKERQIPGGFNPDNYTVEREWATAPDGVKVPVALVYKKGMKKDGNNPTLIYGYGSYGYSTDASFNSGVFSLVDRGFIYALAQVRGGSEMGEKWYEDGKLMKKMNTFTDFIACTEYLVQAHYTTPAKIAIMGGSAGGLLVGAVTNMRPDLFHVVIALVPFVDVINTMLDEILPLTTQEFEQWGNPKKEADYRYILSYSPYDNVKAQNYPNILVRAGLNDSQVSYHEPAKWVAKLRALKTDSNLVILKVNMSSGHGGATGRFENLKERAAEYAFILDRMGMDQ